MALKKVKRPVIKGEDTEAVNETVKVTEATEAVNETAGEAKTETKDTPKTTVAPAKKATAPAKKATTPAKKNDKKAPKKVEPKAVKENIVKEDEEEGQRATKKKVVKLTQQFLEENDELVFSLENITRVINAFETVLGDVTNVQSYKFMNGMIQVQQRNGQVFKSPKVDYFSYKAPRTVKTFTQDTENVDKFRGQYDPETKVFKADGKWNYDTKEFESVDLEIVVGQEDAQA